MAGASRRRRPRLLPNGRREGVMNHAPTDGDGRGMAGDKLLPNGHNNGPAPAYGRGGLLTTEELRQPLSPPKADRGGGIHA